MTQDYSHIVWPKDFPDEQKGWFKAMMDRQMEEKYSIQVIYHPSCGCQHQQLYILDRYPMSEKIHSRCQSCNKYSLDEISDPILFYNPIEDKELTLDDLRKYVVTDSNRQAPYLKAYQMEATSQSPEKASDEAGNPG